MKQVGTLKLYTLDEVLDEQIGKKGTPARDEHEKKVEEAVHAYLLGEAIKAERIRQHMTQEQLGDRAGVKKAQISKIEKGNSITLSTMSRVFKALGITTATLDLGTAGKVALW